ncbi:MAG: DNA repair protein RecN [Verrucomicrobia subdivision 3 bacterium]|nr:DNA repair protein RecN [Limisphaerales bacterium]
MLDTLRIRNLALVTDLTLELGPGYNAISGETGAGKSILIGALNLVLGERADRTLIRAEADQCTVEANFDVAQLDAPLPRFLEEHGLEPCEENQLLLKRTFTTAGSNRQFVNGSATTLAVLKRIGEWLVDMHGPHDHQSLLHPARQLAILDAFGGLQQPRAAFTTLLQRRTEIEQAKADLVVDEATYAQQLDLLRFQVKEITGAALDPAEEENLEADYQRSSNAARLLELCQGALQLVSENEGSLLDRSGDLGRVLADLQQVDDSAAGLVELHEEARANLQELQSALTVYADRVDIDPAQLASLEERVNLAQSLKRKYGGSIEAVNTFGEEAAQKLATLESRDEELARLNAELNSLETNLIQSGQKLSAQRQKLIPKLTKAVTSHLNDLGFAQSQLDVALSSTDRPAEVKASGLDTVEFQFAPNPGEPARPLRAIASSGELARVMLALKTVLAAEDSIPVLIFDEVDANVGGETAHAVGERMRQIADQRQVLCITHLAPVAAAAQAHYVVSKAVIDGRTESNITPLNAQARVDELARMLGGQSTAARKHAEELLR